MGLERIVVRGAREHNLKNVNLDLPRNKLIVITGVSGSGKSSLAFDTIYAEGQRRYVESLSAYARQFLEQMDKPDVDVIEGLSPAISIEQKTTSRNPRSTVGTVTEIYDYLRLLFARVGQPFCYNCGREIKAQSVQEITDRVMDRPEKTRLQVLSPVVIGRKGEFVKLFEGLIKEGFLRAKVDGEIHDLNAVPPLNKKQKHDIDVVVDRIVLKEEVRSRLAESLELALQLSDGLVKIDLVDSNEELFFSSKRACISCGISYPELTPQIFSFNSPQGACPSCAGLGLSQVFDAALIVPNPNLSIREGALHPWRKRNSVGYFNYIQAIADHLKIDLDTPWKDLPEKARQVFLHGSGKARISFFWETDDRKRFYEQPFEGLIPNLERRHRETGSSWMREELEKYMTTSPCPVCQGTRLRPEARSVRVGESEIFSVTGMSVAQALDWVTGLRLSEHQLTIARRVLKEIEERLGFLNNVGLDYLTLDRTSGTLSGGEGQRIRLATQIGSALVGVLYILDEPSIGLHQRDNRRLLDTLIGLRDLGNTVIVVEHDSDTILTADHVVDMGPGAGEHGGEVVFSGPSEEILADERSLTGRYLSGRDEIPLPKTRRRPSGRLVLKGASLNNLQEAEAVFPLGCFTCVTGVSGSGKSSLVIDTLYRALSQKLHRAKTRPGPYQSLEGLNQIDKVIDIDQTPIGRTPRSNPATYTGTFTPIRDLFAQLPEAKIRGYKPGRFSFNVTGGRCPQCQGDGIIKIEMHFLPDVYVKCDLCKGKRYNRETLEIKYKGQSISDVLEMTISQAHEFFEAIPSINNKLATLRAVGLGYLRLGQPATTLSGGEAQRIKLSKELSKRDTGRTLYILDEPTTGLHFDDIKKLLTVLNELVERGNTVIVIEHNLEVIKSADHIIDLGPEGGDRGGRIIAQGSPEEIIRVKESHTGMFLKGILGK